MALLKYSLLRLGVFGVTFYLCLFVDLGQFTLVFALIIGLIVSWAVGYLFFNQWRLAAGQQLAGLGRRKRRRSSAEAADNAAEDQLAEDFHHSAAPQPETSPHAQTDPQPPGEADPDEEPEPRRD